MEATKPVALRVRPEQIPAELKEWPQWVVWRYEWQPDKRNRRTGELGSWDKIPYNARTGGLASSTNRQSWSSFEEAVSHYQGSDYDGISFALSADDPFAGADFDEYVHEGSVDAKVAGVVTAFASYAEISPSGTGVRIIAKGAIPSGGRGRNNREKRAELYDRTRFLTITGHSLNGASIHERQAQVEQLYQALERKLQRSDEVPLGGDPGLLGRARGARNGLKFQALYDYGTIDDYPSDSEADLALCSLLAFWTRKDAGRMDRLFRESRLMRPKWDERHGELTYGQLTIAKAIESTNQVVSPGADGHEKPRGLSYYARGRQRVWVIHFPFGDIEVGNELVAKFGAVEAACSGGEVARLPEYEPTPLEWRTWLREQMPLAEELPSFPELDERGRVVAAILRHLSESPANELPTSLRLSGVWLDGPGRRWVIAAGTLRTNLDNQYKPWLTGPLMHSVLLGEFGGQPDRVWLPSGNVTRQAEDNTRPRVVVVAADRVAELQDGED